MQRKYTLSISIIILLLIAILNFSKDRLRSEAGNADPILTLKHQIVEHYADLVFANYRDTYTQALALRSAIDAFLAQPTSGGLETAREAWRAAREPYGQTEAFRFYGGPIDDENGPEGLLNAWPLDESYVDYVHGNPNAGIINDLENFPQLTPELLTSLNERGSEENVSIGFHAIEFLLWGQDFDANGPGSRPFTDFIENGSAPHPQRRAMYLQTCADLLVQHLRQLRDAWDPQRSTNYREAFLAQPVDDALQKMLTGIGILSKSELAGERMYTAYDNANQEDEHSCFSDNTHRDLLANARGIENVYHGMYQKIDGETLRGPSLRDLIEQVAADRNAQLMAQMELALAAVRAIPAPFDQAIIDADSRPKVLTAVLALQKLGNQLAEVAEVLGLRINTGLPQESTGGAAS